MEPVVNILHLTTAYRRNSSDIITPWMVDLLDELSKEHRITVFTSAYKRTDRIRTDGNIKVMRFSYAPSGMQRMTHDLTINDFLRKHVSYYFMLPLFILAGAIQLFTYCLKDRPDIITVHWPFPMALIAIPCRILLRIPLVYVWYGAEIKLFRKSFRKLRFLLRYIASKAAYSIAISSYTLDQLSQLVKLPRFAIIPYGIRMPEKKIIEKEKMILFVGRLVERKGIKYLIDAMKYVNEGYELIIAGTGPLLEGLKAQAKAFNRKTVFEGRVTDERKEELYRKAAVFVLPAVHDSTGDTEGLGMVLVEAMSYNTPVVATGIGGITDIIKDKFNGLLAREADAEDIAKQINILLENHDIRDRLMKNADKSICEGFIIKSIAEKYREVYEKIIQ